MSHATQLILFFLSLCIASPVLAKGLKNSSKFKCSHHNSLSLSLSLSNEKKRPHTLFSDRHRNLRRRLRLFSGEVSYSIRRLIVRSERWLRFRLSPSTSSCSWGINRSAKPASSLDSCTISSTTRIR